MPAEQALAEARKQVGPSYVGGGGSDAFRARLEESAAFLAPLALVGGLALAGGGYELAPRHIAGLAVWLVVAGLLALGAAGRATLGRPFYWAGGLILGLALLSAISSLWSGSIELSVTEADRVLVYLGVFLAAFLIAQTDQRRQRFAEGLAIGLILIACIGLLSRLLPDVLSVGNGPGGGTRLAYPLDYWNADGLVFGIAAALSLWVSRRSLIPFLRWVAVAALPVALLALYFTYSRGGLLALLVAAGVLIALSHDRLWLIATLAIGALATLPALLVVQADRSLADNLGNQAAVDQGATVFFILLAGIAVALALFAGLRQLERRGGGMTDRAVSLSRDRRVLAGIGLALAVVAIGAAIAVGGRAWDRFSSSDIQFPSDPSQHLTDLGGGGRSDFWRVAIDGFEEKPVFGSGAGTYQFTWNELRSIQHTVHDAHSLYLEAFSELGLVGGLLVLAMVVFLLWTGFSAWRAARGIQRELYAALLAACAAFAVGAAIDWFWEIAAVGAIFFLASGALVAGRCAQLTQAKAASNGQGERRRFGLAVAGLAIAWITALALIGPLLVDRELDASQSAASDGNIGSAIEHANTARSIEPWAASPYRQLALLAEYQSDYPTALQRINQAIDREDRNWQLYYVKARIENAAGETAASEADLAEALRLNPLESCLELGPEGCG